MANQIEERGFRVKYLEVVPWKAFFAQLRLVSEQFLVRPVPYDSKDVLQVHRDKDKCYSLFYKTFEVSKVYVQSPNDADCWYSYPVFKMCKLLVREKCAKSVSRPPAPDPNILHGRIEV